MKYIDEYRSNNKVQSLIQAIERKVTRPWHIMEICGGQTHAIARYRLEDMLPGEIRLLHGPGCPVCVTPRSVIDFAIGLSMQPDIILTSFGDMMRVPGNYGDLLRAKAKGGDIRILYSSLDAVQLAIQHPEKEIIFLAVGFETTIPVYLITLQDIIRRKLKNFSLLTSLFTVPPAMDMILSDPSCKINGFLTAGHVCAITGIADYHPLAKKYKTPMVVTGFEPVDLLYGIYHCISQLEAGTYTVENAYKRVVSDEGNPKARSQMVEMLEPCNQEWRGMGIFPQSGLKLKEKYKAYDVQKKFGYLRELCLEKSESLISAENCIAGEIMRGLKQPDNCPYFGTDCQPAHPVGAPMVSSEGACSAYFKYR